MIRILQDVLRRARKHYRCDATAWFRACGGTSTHDLTPDQQLHFEAANADRDRILPGQTYRYQCVLVDGSVRNWRARPGMEAVCRELGIYAGMRSD